MIPVDDDAWKIEFARCKPWLMGALEHCRDSHSIEDIYDAIGRKELQFWPGKNAAAVTQICKYPKLKVFHIFLAGGSMKEMVEMLKDGEYQAKLNGCQRVRLIGRPGWTRTFLARTGYEPTGQVILEKELA